MKYDKSKGGEVLIFLFETRAGTLPLVLQSAEYTEPKGTSSQLNKSAAPC
jgi:hypothetical protein